MDKEFYIKELKKLIPNPEDFEEVYKHASGMQVSLLELFISPTIKSIFMPGKYTELLDFIDGNGFVVDYDCNVGMYTVSRLT